MCKQGLLTEITTDLIARMVRRYFGWDRIPTDKEVDEFLFSVKEKLFDVRPCASMDTQLLATIRREAVAKGARNGD